MTEFVMFVLAYYSDEALLESGFILFILFVGETVNTDSLSLIPLEG